MELDQKLITSKRRMWRFFGLGLAMLAAGTVATILGAQGIGFVWYGWVGVVVLFSGVALCYGVVDWARRIDKREAAGPTGRTEPDPSEDTGTISWVKNEYPSALARRERRWRLSLIPVVPWFMLSWALVVLQPPFPNWLIGVTVGSAFVSIYPLAFCLINALRRDSRFAAARVGLSPRGIHVEYDSGRLRVARWPDWAPTYIPWNEVASVSAPAYRGSTHQLNFDRVGGGHWRLIGLDPDIVAKVLADWDASPVRLLPSTSE